MTLPDEAILNSKNILLLSVLIKARFENFKQPLITLYAARVVTGLMLSTALMLLLASCCQQHSCCYWPNSVISMITLMENLSLTFFESSEL